MHPFTLTEEEVQHVAGGDVVGDVWSCDLPIPPLDGGCILTINMGETGGYTFG